MALRFSPDNLLYQLRKTRGGIHLNAEGEQIDGLALQELVKDWRTSDWDEFHRLVAKAREKDKSWGIFNWFDDYDYDKIDKILALQGKQMEEVARRQDSDLGVGKSLQENYQDVVQKLEKQTTDAIDTAKEIQEADLITRRKQAEDEARYREDLRKQKERATEDLMKRAQVSDDLLDQAIMRGEEYASSPSIVDAEIEAGVARQIENQLLEDEMTRQRYGGGAFDLNPNSVGSFSRQAQAPEWSHRKLLEEQERRNYLTELYEGISGKKQDLSQVLEQFQRQDFYDQNFMLDKISEVRDQIRQLGLSASDPAKARFRDSLGVLGDSRAEFFDRVGFGDQVNYMANEGKRVSDRGEAAGRMKGNALNQLLFNLLKTGAGAAMTGMVDPDDLTNSFNSYASSYATANANSADAGRRTFGYYPQMGGSRPSLTGSGNRHGYSPGLQGRRTPLMPQKTEKVDNPDNDINIKELKNLLTGLMG